MFLQNLEGTLKVLRLECKREAGGAGDEWLRRWLPNGGEVPRSEGHARVNGETP